MDVQTFLRELGGAAQIARDLDIPLTTVATWGQRNKIPRWRMPALVSLAIKRGKPIPPTLMEAA